MQDPIECKDEQLPDPQRTPSTLSSAPANESVPNSVTVPTAATVVLENVQPAVQEVYYTASAAPYYASPLTRHLAKSNDIPLDQVTGTGKNGRITRQDVQDVINSAAVEPSNSSPATTPAPASQAAEEPTAAPAANVSGSPANVPGCTTVPLTRLRSIIAQRMVDSLRVSAQLTTVVEVDLSRVSLLREQVKAEFAEREGVKLTLLPFIAAVTIDALRVHPLLNATLNEPLTEVTYYDVVNLGVAVDTDKGLLVPVVAQASDLSIAGLAKAISDLAARARSSKLKVDELAGGTFTITNTGSRGALFDTPIINQPQVAILGLGTTTRRPVVVPTADGGEAFAIRDMAYVSLTYDHRLVDGAHAARFLTTIKARLERGQLPHVF